MRAAYSNVNQSGLGSCSESLTCSGVVLGGVLWGLAMVYATTPSSSAPASDPFVSSIATKLASSDPAIQLEGKVARAVQSQLVALNKGFGPNNSLGEIDVETVNAIIEVTIKNSGKLSQVTKLMTDPIMNPTSKPVILFAPYYNGTPTKDIVNAGGYVVKSLEELQALVQTLGGGR